MDKFMSKIEERVTNLASKLSSNRYLSAIQLGFLVAMPLTVIGSICLLIACFPVTAFSNMMVNIFGSGWAEPLLKVNSVTMSVIGLFVMIGISYSLSKHYQLDTITSIASVVSGYLLLNNFTENGNIAIQIFGSDNLFLVILSSIVSIEVIRFITMKKWVIKLPDSVPANIQSSFSSLIPAAVLLILFTIIRLLFAMTPFGTIGQFINTVFQYPLLALTDTLPAAIIFVIFEKVLWCFGIHGSNIVGAVNTTMLTALTVENASNVAAGLAPTNIINTQFFANFVRLGGAGATLGLVVAIFLFGKSKRYKSLGKLAIGPLAFQINEPVIFGFPIVMNPVMMVPFVLSPLANCIICYGAFALGLVPICNGANIPWNTPPFISGWLVSGWQGLLLQVVCLVINVMIWLPFFKVCDNQAYKEEMLEEL